MQKRRRKADAAKNYSNPNLSLALQNLKDVIKRGRKKYNYQHRKAGGLRSPRESSANGSATATVRLLKELGNKSVAMQRSLDDLAQVTKDR